MSSQIMCKFNYVSKNGLYSNKTPDGHTNKKPQKDKTMVNNNFLVGENNALPSFFFVFCSCIHVCVINCAYNCK